MGSRFIKEGQLIYLKSPDFNELDEVAKLWSDEATMKEVGGTVVFKKERYQDWYQRMINPGDGKNHYCLIYNNQNKVVGEVSFPDLIVMKNRLNSILKFMIASVGMDMQKRPRS